MESKENMPDHHGLPQHPVPDIVRNSSIIPLHNEVPSDGHNLRSYLKYEEERKYKPNVREQYRKDHLIIHQRLQKALHRLKVINAGRSGNNCIECCEELIIQLVFHNGIRGCHVSHDGITNKEGMIQTYCRHPCTYTSTKTRIN
eukprot:198381_1